jgi:hypothetical protein
MAGGIGSEQLDIKAMGMDFVMATQCQWKHDGNSNEWLGNGWRDGDGNRWLGNGRLGNGRLGNGWRKGLAMDGLMATQR